MKMFMKAEVSVWIWILGLTVMGVLIFSIGMSIGGNHISNVQRFMVAQEHANLLDKIKVVCQSDIGNLYPYRSDFPENIKAVYSSKIISPPPDKVSVMITRGERSVGNHLCIQSYNDEPVCEKVNCDIDMAYMGTPSMKEDLLSKVNKIIGRDTIHSYEMVIEKTGTDLVYIDSEKVMSSKETASCGNKILEIGEDCDSSDEMCEDVYGSCSSKTCMDCACVVELDCGLCATVDQVCVVDSDWYNYCRDDMPCP